MKRPLLAFFLLAAISFPHHAYSDETAALNLLVKTLRQTNDDTIRGSILTGMLKGLEGRRRVQSPRGWNELSQSLSKSEVQKVRNLSMELSQFFGDIEATKESLAILNDSSATASLRRNALRSLLAQRNEDASDSLELLLDDPDLAIDAVRGYAAIENAVAPAILLARYGQMDSDLKRSVIETLATRRFYASQLLSAVQSNRVPREDIPVHVARALNELLGARYVEVFGELRPIGDDREKLLVKYKSLLTRDALTNGNASRGRAIYQKSCASCHVLYGEGGKIGPDLTGSNRANLDYILLNSIDPSYDVAEGYRTVIVATEDGRLIMGVVSEEDATKLVLKTVEQPRLVIAKEDIVERKISKKSMMPDGQLEQMKPQEVIDLIKYLRTTEQVEVSK